MVKAMTCVACPKPALYYPKDQYGYNPLCYTDYRKYFETGFVPKKVIKMQLNEQIILNYMVHRQAFPGSPGIHRSSIVADCNIPRTTAYDTLVRLERKDIVERFTKTSDEAGRPMKFWRLTTEEF